MEGQLCALFHTALNRGVEHPQTVVSLGSPRTNPPWKTKFWRNQKLYVDFQLRGRSAPLNPVLVKDQLYLKSMNCTLYGMYMNYSSIKLHTHKHTHTHAHNIYREGRKKSIGGF